MLLNRLNVMYVEYFESFKFLKFGILYDNAVYEFMVHLNVKESPTIDYYWSGLKVCTFALTMHFVFYLEGRGGNAERRFGYHIW